MFKRIPWMRLSAAIAGGAVLLQTSACADVTGGVTAVASTITAGGVLYIVRQILLD